MVDGIFETEVPPVEAIPVAELPPVAMLLRTFVAAELTTLVMLLVRFTEFGEARESVCDAKKDPAEMGTDPNVVGVRDATDERTGADVASSGTQSCWRFASKPLRQVTEDLQILKWSASFGICFL
jgi:hypothetical protein